MTYMIDPTRLKMSLNNYRKANYPKKKMRLGEYERSLVGTPSSGMSYTVEDTPYRS